VVKIDEFIFVLLAGLLMIGILLIAWGIPREESTIEKFYKIICYDLSREYTFGTPDFQEFKEYIERNSDHLNNCTIRVEERVIVREVPITESNKTI